MVLNPYESPMTPDPSDEVVEAEAVNIAEPWSDGYYHPPKLSLEHRVAWFVLASACLVISYLQGSFRFETWDLGSTILKANLLLGIVFVSAGVLGTFIIARDKLRRVSGRLQPGHWLLIIVSMTCLVSWLLVVITRLLFGPPEVIIASPGDTFDPPGIWYILRWHTVGFATAIAYLVMAFRIRERLIWSLLALVLAIMTIGGVLWQLASAYAFCGSTWIERHHADILLGASQWIGIAALIIVTICLLKDHNQHRRRDWLHWLGVTLLVVWIWISVFTPMVIEWIITW